MEIHEPIPGLKVITPDRHGDHRGFFSEVWNQRGFSELGVDIAFVQDNISFSAQAGTVRGLHYQSPPHAQVKLVRCGRGRLFDVAVDIRKGSPTFGNWFGIELSFENARQLLVPAGFLHGFMTCEADTEISYKCSDYYAPEAEGTIRWDDPEIGIEWPLSGTPILSGRDAEAAPLASLDSPFLWQGSA